MSFLLKSLVNCWMLLMNVMIKFVFRRVALVAMGKLDRRFIEHAWRPALEDFSQIHEFEACHTTRLSSIPDSFLCLEL